MALNYRLSEQKIAQLDSGHPANLHEPYKQRGHGRHNKKPTFLSQGRIQQRPTSNLENSYKGIAALSISYETRYIKMGIGPCGWCSLGVPRLSPVSALFPLSTSAKAGLGVTARKSKCLSRASLTSRVGRLPVGRKCIQCQLVETQLAQHK